VDGGNDYHRCAAHDWANFLRVDDEGNEIVPKVVDENMPVDNGLSDKKLLDEPLKTITKSDLLKQLDAMIENIERLPEIAMTLPISHYDFVNALILIQTILKSN
jgi:hypothetical protein